ncbi:MAG TPA: hotdog fold thioesterase [Bacteroidales bacterium]|nr:hotdog fold thioesterase [Bacteroidales bacterium]
MNNSSMLAELNENCRNTLVEHLGIEFTDIAEGMLVAKMPVDNRTIQPMKLLHGGATMALAETVGSAGSFTLIDRNRFYVVGMEINANHVGSATSGFVTGTGRLLHKGKRTHVWEILVNDQFGNPVSICRMTNMIMEIKDVLK